MRVLVGDDLFTVAEVARRTGVTRKALRHYEQLGLLRPRSRTDAGYRLYDDEALRRLDLVARAKSLGLSLAETEEFIAAADTDCGEDHGELAAIVERKLAETDQRLVEISSLRETLQGVLERLTRGNIGAGCGPAVCTCSTPTPV